MKFTVDIELDWIEEGGSIDDEVKHQIISRIESSVLSSLQRQVQDSAKAKIEAEVSTLIQQGVTEKMNELMQQERTATDSYGRVTREKFTLEQLLIDAIDSAITKKTLDEHGRPTDGYGVKYTQFEYFATRNIPKLIDERVKALTEATKKDIESLVTSKIKTEVADKLTALIVDNSTALSLRK